MHPTRLKKIRDVCLLGFFIGTRIRQKYFSTTLNHYPIFWNIRGYTSVFKHLLVNNGNVSHSNKKINKESSMLVTNKVSFIRFISLGLASVFLMVSAGQAIAAKGAGGGRTFEVAIGANGACVFENNTVAPLATPNMVLRSSQGIIYYIMQVIGSNSVGTWDVTFTKDGVAGAPITSFVIPPPGGWALTGGQLDKGAKSVKVVGVARNRNNGAVCTAIVEKIL
jgi:hypothetical protein